MAMAAGPNDTVGKIRVQLQGEDANQAVIVRTTDGKEWLINELQWDRPNDRLVIICLSEVPGHGNDANALA